MAHYGAAAPSRVLYGWWVAAAFSLIIVLSTGIRFAVGPFPKPVVRGLNLERGTFSLVISLSLFLYGVFTPLVGPLADRWGSRIVCSLGAVVMAGSLMLTGTMTSALSADIFGRFSVGSIFRLNFLIRRMGSALGAWLAGFPFDLSGSYGSACGVACALFVVGAWLSLMIDVVGRPRLRRELLPVAGGS